MRSQIARYSTSLIVIAAFAVSGPVLGAPPDVTVSDAKIAGGRLVISGKTASAGMKLRLDGKTAASFNAVSRFDKSFSLSVVYIPRDCIVTIQKVLPGGQLGVPGDAVIANCAPSVIAPRGTWNATASYEMTDVVAFKGASWLATEDNLNKMPGDSESWQLFAAGNEFGKTALAESAETSGTAAAVRPASSAARRSSSDTAARAIPSGAAGGDLDGTYPDPDIRNQAVTTTKLAPLAVTTGKIQDGAVTAVKIEDGAITSAKVLDDIQPGGGLTSADLASGSVTASELATDSVNASEIADDSIDSGEIVDGSLTGTDIASGTITGANIANGSIDADDIESNSLTSTDLAGGLATGGVTFGGGSVPNGRCIRVELGIGGGAAAGDAVVISWRGSVQNGVFLYGTRVVSATVAEAYICNFSGTTMAPISNVPIRLITFR